MGVSTMRPETHAAPSWKRSPSRFDALWMIRDAVRRRRSLIFGKLEEEREGKKYFCAIGAFFEDNPKLALNTAIIDEVAAYNDSIPKAAKPSYRRRKVLEWLNAKVAALKMGVR